MPYLDQLERAFGGHDLSGLSAHVGGPAEPACAELGAGGFLLGDAVAFAGPPSLEVAAHEAAHFLMQRSGQAPSGPAGEAGDPFERHADEVAARVVRGESAADLLPSPERVGQTSPAGSPVQCYTEGSGGVKVSENGNILFEAAQSLFAAPSMIASANAKLQSAGKDGSLIELQEGSDSRTEGGKTLKSVQPTWIDGKASGYHQGAEDANQPGAKDSNGADGGPMALWTDCGRASAAVTGSQTGRDRSVVFNKDGQQTTGKGVSTPGATFNGAMPNDMASQIFLELIPGFVARADNQTFLQEGVHFVWVDRQTSKTLEGVGAGALAGMATGAAAGAWLFGLGAVPGAIAGGVLGGLAGGVIASSLNSSERVRQYVQPTDATHAKRMYATLSAAGQDRFDREAGINHYADPEVGESYAMATEPEMPGFHKTGKRTWNYHWAGVIMKDGGDNVTLENYAVADDDGDGLVRGVPSGDFIDRDWSFAMYGTRDKSQSFHQAHLDTNTHGSHATSIRVRTDP